MAKRILVPVSQSEPAPSFLTAVTDLARGAGATVRLLHVAAPVTNLVDGAGRVVAYSDQETRRVEDEARDYLETVSLGFEGIPVELVVRFGDIADEILAEADEFGADLIVLAIGKRPRLRVRQAVAKKVFRGADAPVAFIRPGRHESGGS